QPPKQEEKPASPRPSQPVQFRPLAVLEGHRGHSFLSNVTISPDGRLGASSDHRGRIIVYDLPSGKERQRLGTPGGHVADLAFTPDTRSLLFGGLRGLLLQRLDAAEPRRLAQQGVVQGVAVSPDGRRGLSGGEGHTVRLWDLQEGKQLQRFLN